MRIPELITERAIELTSRISLGTSIGVGGGTAAAGSKTLQDSHFLDWIERWDTALGIFIATASLVVHLVFSYLGYRLKKKKSPPDKS